MRIALFASFLAVSLSPAVADDNPVDCDAVYQRLKVNAPGDASICKLKLSEPKYEECTPPTSYSSERPASHVVLVLDASGSMAGKSGGETKMAVAKREAFAFLSHLQDDVPVGLMVYGHRGNNQESGKAESCAATEWAHKIGASKAALTKSIDALQPTGWTPLGGVLAYAKDELADLPKNEDDKISVPVVYLTSDGEETCGGDPVAEAKALHEAGVRATVNVIGFGVDDETRAQLAAISEAGGGRYFPAEDARALSKQLKAIQDSERSRARYAFCQLVNLGWTERVYHDAGVDLMKCFNRESKTKALYPMLAQIKALDAAGGPEKSCAGDLKRQAYSDYTDANEVMLEQNEMRQAARDKGLADLRAKSVFKPLDDK